MKARVEALVGEPLKLYGCQHFTQCVRILRRMRIELVLNVIYYNRSYGPKTVIKDVLKMKI